MTGLDDLLGTDSLTPAPQGARWADVRDVPPQTLPDVLLEHWEDLHPKDLRSAVREAWTSQDDPEALLDAETWAELFDEAGYQVDGRPADKESDLEPLMDDVVLTLYRAAREPRGLGWTTDLRAARAAAARDGGRVWRVALGPEYVLARFTDPWDGTEQLVVDVTDLDGGDFRPV
ncbi:hypothetical protein DNL40_00565 [Xylanimonas oleitrophica]|uniref:Uncharacterized protein n=1 Tax=Xylanimonas oleitrophica TaxID=2607479 RepID=A0A2W5XWI5_9MICO|nr:hypothetical protein [Xylanimonas oleitrophica]PZR54928.1 hypothetical protein DNL40_00565 [Xylanimonas oleitrophica]